MAKKLAQIKNFSGGLNSYSDPRDIKDSEFQALDNVTTDETARIRLSGGFEDVNIEGNLENDKAISLPVPSAQIESIVTDYKPTIIPNSDFNANLTGESPSSWETTSGDGAGWLIDDGAFSPENPFGGKILSNIKSSISTNAVADMGSITSSPIKLEPGAEYKLEFSMMANQPYYYQPLSELPRIRILNNALSKYLETAGWKDSDNYITSLPNAIPHAVSNLAISPVSESSSFIGFSGQPGWHAGTYSTIARVSDTSASLSSYLGEGQNYVLEITTNSSNTDDIIAYTEDIAIDMSNFPGGELTFDYLYKTNDTNIRPMVQIFDVTNNILPLAKSNEASLDTYTNANMGVEGWEYGTPNENNLGGTTFTLQDNCTAIKIRIRALNYGAGSLSLTGFRLYSSEALTFGGSIAQNNPICEGHPMGYTTSYAANIGFPNTWNQTYNSPYVLNSWSLEKVQMLKRPRKYSYTFSIPDNFEESDDWQFSINAGKWGSSQELSNFGIYIYYIKLIQLSNDSNKESVNFVLYPFYDEEANITKIKGKQWNKKTNHFVDFPQSYNNLLPSYSGKANVNFQTVYGRTFISNSSFNSTGDTWQFFYDTVSGEKTFKGTSVKPFIPEFQELLSVTNLDIVSSNIWDASDYYVNRAAENTKTLNFRGGNSTEVTVDGTYTGDELNTRDGVIHYFTRQAEPNYTGDHEWEAEMFSNVMDGSNAGGQGFQHPDPASSQTPTDEDALWGDGAGGESDSNDPIHKLIELTSTELNAQIPNDIYRIQIRIKHKWDVGYTTVVAWNDTDTEGDEGHNTSWRQMSADWNTEPGEGEDEWRGVSPPPAIRPQFEISLHQIENDLREGYQEINTIREQTIGSYFNINNTSTGAYTSPLAYESTGYVGNDEEYGGFTGNVSAYNGGMNEHIYSIDWTFPNLGDLSRSNNYSLKFKALFTGLNGYNSRWARFASRRQMRDERGDVHGYRGIRSFDHWEIMDIDITPFSEYYNNATNVLSLSDNSVGINYEFGTPNNGSGSGWGSGDYLIRLSTVNFFDEESHLGDQERTFNNTQSTHAPTISFQVSTANSFLDKLIKTIKVYMKKPGQSNFTLQFSVDLIKNEIIAANTGVKELAGTFQAQDGSEVIAYNLHRENLRVYNTSNTYEYETNIQEIDAGNSEILTARWKTSCIVNNRMYVGNIMQNGIIYPDRMLKSVKDKYGIIPSTNFIDVAINDGDQIVSLQYFGDKLLQFKSRRLFIINVSNENDEYLEQTIEGVGILSESQITKTIHGICWINKRGLFLFDGNAVRNLIEDKLAISKWKQTISGWDIDDTFLPILGYDKKSDKLIIMPTGYSSQDIYESNQDGNDSITGNSNSDNIYENTWRTNLSYIYDFRRKGFSINYAGQRGINTELPYYLEENNSDAKLKMPPISGKKSDFFYDIHDNLLIASDYDIGNFYKYNDDPSSTPGLQDFFNDRNMRIVTKDYDFGDAALSKKIYKVYVTFKSTNKETMLVENANLTKDLYASSFVKVYYAINGTNEWKEFDSNKSKNYDATKGLIDEKSENTTTLTNAITSTDTNITVGSTSNILKGYIVKINDEHMLVENVPNSTTLNVKRGYGYTADNVNSYKSLTGDEHEASSTITISNGDWIQAELIPKESLNKIKSLKLMFVQAKIEPETETVTNTYLGEELVNFNESLIDHSYYRDAGTFEVVNNTTFSWTGVGNSNNSGYTHSLIYELLEHDDFIGFGEKAQITLTVSNYTDLSDGSQKNIRIAGSIADATKGGLDVSTNTGLHLSENGTRTVEWTRPPFETWGSESTTQRLNSTGFYLRCGDGCTATIELSIKKILSSEEIVQVSGTPGNVPKGFQINDISLVYRAKRVR